LERPRLPPQIHRSTTDGALRPSHLSERVSGTTMCRPWLGPMPQHGFIMMVVVPIIGRRGGRGREHRGGRRQERICRDLPRVSISEMARAPLHYLNLCQRKRRPTGTLAPRSKARRLECGPPMTESTASPPPSPIYNYQATTITLEPHQGSYPLLFCPPHKL
jgi:hypothetical protein